ncbi:type II toxin-antitoxin system Phd/YefM family antitoxin [Oscillatoria sp. FACHB-1406]|uniref:type II toxin-antitoxin system Phd/YefM family antitoxin n=1 Tax=Oscillatoria sp. FACHB-1406 TaxID=2692846 RepID=UPI00168502AC|nr:type II toxin-antitoxin system Phd/YefM family antitoxin [Oscillatoria sp. FACHB-1406]MBD2579838.1 type II toxin-antitoxin system Phd/YefM family antitoxin [Oscillatoria sp. FACHB-1406]
MIYSYFQAQERLSSLLERALSEGQVKLRSRDGRVFIIRPEQPIKSSPFEVRSLKLPINKADILEAIRESRARF